MNILLKGHSPVTTTWMKVRNDLRDRAQARAARRSYARELASYRTGSEVEDLLAVVDHDATPDAKQVRQILVRKLSESQTRSLCSV